MIFLIDSPKHGILQCYISRQERHLLDNGVYACKAGAFLYIRVKPNKQLLHRLIMNVPKGKVTDHINRDTLDNRRENLRIVTIQQNLWNQKRPNNKTGITGVALHSHGYTAQIKVNYKKIHLGLFKTIEEATKVRKEAEKKYYVI